MERKATPLPRVTATPGRLSRARSRTGRYWYPAGRREPVMASRMPGTVVMMTGCVRIHNDPRKPLFRPAPSLLHHGRTNLRPPTRTSRQCRPEPRCSDPCNGSEQKFPNRNLPYSVIVLRMSIRAQRLASVSSGTLVPTWETGSGARVGYATALNAFRSLVRLSLRAEPGNMSFVGAVVANDVGEPVVWSVSRIVTRPLPRHLRDLANKLSALSSGRRDSKLGYHHII